MKLQEIIYESTSTALRKEVVEVLSESIIEYFGTTLAKLKGAHPEEVFSDQNPKRVSLEDVAKMITALKVISKKEYRGAMTKDDIGINPNSARDVFSLLDAVKKDGQNDRNTKEVMDTLAHLAPSMYRRELEALKDLKLDDDAKRKQAVQKLEAFMLKASQFFQKLKTNANSNGKAVTE